MILNISTASIGLRPLRFLRSFSYNTFRSVRNISQSITVFRRASGSPSSTSFSSRARSSKKPWPPLIRNAPRCRFPMLGILAQALALHYDQAMVFIEVPLSLLMADIQTIPNKTAWISLGSLEIHPGQGEGARQEKENVNFP